MSDPNVKINNDKDQFDRPRINPEDPNVSAITFPDRGEYGAEGTVQKPKMVFQIRNPVVNNNGVLNTVVLPMPNTLRVQYKAQYNNVELNSEQITQILGELSAMNTALDNLGRGGLNILDGLSGANFKIGSEIRNGVLYNPHMALHYQGPDFRSFQFEFQLNPKNAKEADQIHALVKIFKLHMHPDAKGEGPGARRLYYPDNFNIYFHSPSDQYLFKVLVCVLEDMQVDYAGGGVASFYKNGAPVDTRITLQFREQSILTKTDIEQGF